jgi:hypothetical protein
MPLQKRWSEVSRPPGRAGEENAVGIKETLEKEARALGNKAGELVAEEGRELLAQAKEKLDEAKGSRRSFRARPTASPKS